MTLDFSVIPESTIAHIDCDCFFVSVELIKQPHLIGKPVCVAGPTGNKGVVTCASYEARPYGIGAGTPTFKARRMCPHATFIKGSFRKYGEISFQLFELLHKITPIVEHSSVDEGYVDLKNLDKVYNRSLASLVKGIQKEIKVKIGVPVSIGLAPTKTLAKLASDRNKPYGVTVVNKENLQEILATSRIRDVCGFGRKNQARIYQLLNCQNLLEFINCDPTHIKKILGIGGLVIWHELQGIPLYKVSNKKRIPKSILRSSMFPHKTNDYNFIRNWIFGRAEEALKKLNRYQLNCSSIGIFIRKQHPYKSSAQQELNAPTADLHKIIPIIKTLFDQAYEENQTYRAAGIWLHNFSSQNRNQLELFSPVDQKSSLTEVLSYCDQALGKNIVTTSSRLKQSKKPDFNLPFIG